MPSLTLLSERQIQTAMLAKLIVQLGLNDINPGSVEDVLTQAASQSDFALYYQIAQVSRLADLDSMTGSDLDLKAFEYGLTRFPAQQATGLVNILMPASFVKVSTTFYAGFPSPIAGDTTIFVNDASNGLYGSSGTLILGRGTTNEEQVSYSTAPVNNTNYFTIALTSALVNNHMTQETVILKQGTDQLIQAGTTLVVPATGTTNQIQFSTVNDATLLAGEAEVDGVEIIAAIANTGTQGNIPAQAINGTSAFPSPPFAGARAVNPSKFTTGVDLESDDALRDRIRAAVPALTKGIKQAIQNAVVGIVDPVTAKRIVSASVVLPVQDAGPVKVYIDDGTGFEPSFSSVGFESIRAVATGGELRLQTNKFPVVKAQVENNVAQLYDMSSGPLTLSYEVGIIPETITFDVTDFRFPKSATAEEIAVAVNKKATLIEARTSQGQTHVVITAVQDTNENIQVTGGTSNAVLGFPTDRKDTINLYVNDVRKSKDGATAVIDSGNQAPYDLLTVGAYPHHLTVVVDGKTANPQTATINLSDVADPAAVTAQEIVNVLNRDLAGVISSTSDNGTKVRIQSNTLLSASSIVQVTGGSANNSVNGLNFSTSPVTGINSDYTFNRELGIVQLGSALMANDSVSAGDLFTRGRIRAGVPELYSPANGQTLIIAVDGGSPQTITFDASFVGGKSAADTATFINQQLLGATAIARKVGASTFLEINTNTYDLAGSIEITSASTGNGAFSFTLNTVFSSNAPNVAYQVSGNSSPFKIARGDTLVLVMDDDIVNGTFSVTFSVDRSVSSATSASVFASSTLNGLFPNNGQLNGFYVGFFSGANTTSGTITTVTLLGGGIARYTYASAPANFSNFAAGDLAQFTGLTNPVNNVNGVITNVGVNYVDILNPNAAAAISETGTGLLGEKRTVSAYVASSGQLTVSSPFSFTPAITDNFVVIPASAQNVVDYLNNTKITSLSLQANVEGAYNDSRVQIASLKDGSDGFVQITGGSANKDFAFSTMLTRGLAGYQFSTGLIDLAHKTIYGDDTDLDTYPGIGAAGVIFEFLAPTVVDLSIELNVTLANGITVASLENQIVSAVTGYVNSLGVGEEVVLEQIRAAVIAIAGITDVAVVTPSANAVVNDNELARVSASNILIG